MFLTVIKSSLLLACYILLGLQNGIAQVIDKEPEHELAFALKVMAGNITYGANEYYITDPHSVYLQPGIRYDYPVKISQGLSGNHYVTITGQAGFLFCRAKKFDSLYFNPGNPTYMPLSAGIYSISPLSIGAEVFFWKGLGNRDMWGTKFLSLGYNSPSFRLNASGEYYIQLKDSRQSGIVYSIEFYWKLIRD